MTPPVLVTAPTVPVVALADLKAHLRIDHDDENAILTKREASAVAYLDGWTGVLGRAIRPQQWRQEFSAGEFVRLAMPDVSAITVVALDSAGSEVSVTTTMKADYKGTWVEVYGAYDTLRVTYTCGMTATQIPDAEILVALMVERDHDRPIGPAYEAISRAIDFRIEAMRWMDF